MIEYELVSRHLRERARVYCGEAFWKWSDFPQVLNEIAAAGRCILGFDVFYFSGEGDRPTAAGVTNYSGTTRPVGIAWNEHVEALLECARRDVANIRGVSGLEPPYDHLWFTVESMSEAESTHHG